VKICAICGQKAKGKMQSVKMQSVKNNQIFICENLSNLWAKKQSAKYLCENLLKKNNNNIILKMPKLVIHQLGYFNLLSF
jgi:ribosome-binding protein aMBF1 (putative translation factor)